MKPPRLKYLIALLYSIALIISALGFLGNPREVGTWFPVNLWATTSLLFFFTAQLLSVPHNSGRIWAFFSALCLFAYSISRVIIYLGLTDTKADITPLAGLYIPFLMTLIALQIIILCFHSSVCAYFDSISIEIKSPEKNALNPKKNSIQ